MRALQNFIKINFMVWLSLSHASRLYIIVTRTEKYEQDIEAVALVWYCTRYESFINTVMFINVQYS